MIALTKLNNKQPPSRTGAVNHKLLGILAGFCLALFSYGCSPAPSPAAPFQPTAQSLAATPIAYDFDPAQEAQPNPYDLLSVPTYITKIGQEYFIVDCYHNQVIFHHNLTDPLTDWSVMTADMVKGHTVASDGQVYLLDDTENNRILIMERRVNHQGNPIFVPTQEFTDIGNRPHYLVYQDGTFYVWSSLTGEMYLFRRPPDSSTVYLTEVRSIPALMGSYVRSFTIIGDTVLFVSGNASIIKADLKTFAVLAEYPVPSQLAGMIQITLIDGYYYITVSTDASGSQDFATIIRTADLETLAEGKYEDVYSHFIGGGTPYYLSWLDNQWFLTEHRLPGHSIWSFAVKDQEIQDVVSVY